MANRLCIIVTDLSSTRGLQSVTIIANFNLVLSNTLSERMAIVRFRERPMVQKFCAKLNDFVLTCKLQLFLEEDFSAKMKPQQK